MKNCGSVNILELRVGKGCNPSVPLATLGNLTPRDIVFVGNLLNRVKPALEPRLAAGPLISLMGNIQYDGFSMSWPMEMAWLKRFSHGLIKFALVQLQHQAV